MEAMARMSRILRAHGMSSGARVRRYGPSIQLYGENTGHARHAIRTATQSSPLEAKKASVSASTTPTVPAPSFSACSIPSPRTSSSGVSRKPR